MPILFSESMEAAILRAPVIKTEPNNTIVPDYHNNRYPCDSCEATFPNVPELQSHLKGHVLSSRPYECHECGKRFSTNSGLKQHLNVHSTVKPFTCDVCQKSYTQFSNLCRHKRMHPGCRQTSPIGDISRTVCSTCGSDFNTSTSLAKHQRFCQQQKNSENEVQAYCNTDYRIEARASQVPYNMPYAMFPTMFPSMLQPMVDYKALAQIAPRATSQLSPNSSVSDVEETEVRPIDQSPRFDVRRVRPAIPVVRPIAFNPKFITWSPGKQDTPFDLSMKSVSPRIDQCEEDPQPLDLSMKKPRCTPPVNESTETTRPTFASSTSSPPSVDQLDRNASPFSTPVKRRESPVPCPETSEEKNNRHLNAMQLMFQQFSPRKAPTTLATVFASSSPMTPPSSSASISPPTNNVLGMNYQQSETRPKSYYPCHYCGKVFPRGANLNRHIRIHTGEKPFKCEFCSRQFSIGSNLKRHIQNVHEKCRVQCTICEKTFGDKSNLDRHMESKHRINRPMHDPIPNKEQHMDQTFDDKNTVIVQHDNSTPTEGESCPEERVIRETHCDVVQPEPILEAMENESVEKSTNDINNNHTIEKMNIKDIYPNFPESDDEDTLYIDC